LGLFGDFGLPKYLKLNLLPPTTGESKMNACAAPSQQNEQCSKVAPLLSSPPNS
jgi:hypothetical protein